MEYSDLATIAGFAFLYSLIASRLEQSRLNGALVYVLAGFVFSTHVLGWVNIEIGGEALKTLAELTLALVLFTDSANTNLVTLRRVEKIPIRLLLIGLPLTIALGMGLGALVFPALGFFEVALLATILAPTDAALGKAVVTNPSVPDSVRESLNVESGLNDGICVPVLLFFLALAVGDAESGRAAELMAELTTQAIGIGGFWSEFWVAISAVAWCGIVQRVGGWRAPGCRSRSSRWPFFVSLPHRSSKEADLSHALWQA